MKITKTGLIEIIKEEMSKLTSTPARNEAMTPADQYRMHDKLNSALKEFVEEYMRLNDLGSSEEDVERVRSQLDYLVGQVLSF